MKPKRVSRYLVGGALGWIVPAIVVWVGVFSIIMGLGSDEKIRAWVGLWIAICGVLIYLLHRLMMLHDEAERDLRDLKQAITQNHKRTNEGTP